VLANSAAWHVPEEQSQQLQAALQQRVQKQCRGQAHVSAPTACSAKPQVQHSQYVEIFALHLAAHHVRFSSSHWHTSILHLPHSTTCIQQ
jgi:hypothetical protein